jgi:hypothetical protein
VLSCCQLGHLLQTRTGGSRACRAAEVTTAAEAAVEGGTVERVETDAEGAAYEAHVTSADGERMTVKLDESFNVTSVEEGDC